ncbi:MAG TPA: glycoside hydrolase family 3 protein [Chloroflexota bacterium]|jgi:beta-N-acetylhexosaminidase|nr:glycoside hydrolase family 3 protein [Chloroflexota bacterium]
MDELVGQLIWAFVTGSEDLEAVEKSIRKGRVGGVWLLPTQMSGPSETAELVNRLQEAAPQPLLIGVDAEAGMGLVMRGATLLPTAMALGASRDPDLVRAAAGVTAREAAACGINAVAAPVLDVNINPANPIINTRAYGEDPDLVKEMGLAFIDGLASAENGSVLPIGKHFPGHGDTVTDSHLQLGMVDKDRTRLDAIELAPFAAVIDRHIPMLMTAHVAYPALDPSGTPATLSAPILTDLLRTQMGFDGVVVTDCMNMHAIAHNFDAAEATTRAVLAGCDLILTDRWDLAYEALLHALLEDEIRGSRIREAAERVRTVKARIFGSQLARPARVDPVDAARVVGSAANLAVADRIAEASVTVVDGALPPPSDRPLILATLMARRFGPSVETQLRSALAAEGRSDVDLLLLNPLPDEAQIREAIEHARAAGWTALLHFNRVESFDPDAVLARDELTDLTDAVAATGTPIVVASMGSPYILPAFTKASATLCSYSTSDASVRAMLRVLLGSGQPAGRVPAAVA